MEMIGLILVGIGVILSLAGYVWFLAVAFQENALWGLGCLFFPILILVFLILHLEVAGKPFAIYVLGVVPIFIGLAMMGSLA